MAARPLGVTYVRPTPLSFSIQPDEARSELKEDILRGHGGRAAAGSASSIGLSIRRACVDGTP